MLLWLATSAVRQQNPVVRFESGAQILIEWGPLLNGKHYERLGDAFKRVFGSTVFFGTKDERRGSEVWSGGRTHFFDHMRLWFRDEELRDGNQGNTVTLSQPFWEELKNHPIPVDTEVIRMLALNPGCLDLYTWLSWRCYKAKRPERIPLFGPQGLIRLHGIARTAATLHLDGGKLKRIMAGGQSSRKLKPTFVELLTPPSNSLVECVIELTGNHGTVRVHLKSASARDVATVTGALWEAVS